MIDTNQIIHNILIEDGIDISVSKLVIDKFVSTIRNHTAKGDAVMVFGLGVFSRTEEKYDRYVNINGELATAKGKHCKPLFDPTKEFRNFVERQGFPGRKIVDHKKKKPE